MNRTVRHVHWGLPQSSVGISEMPPPALEALLLVEARGFGRSILSDLPAFKPHVAPTQPTYEHDR